MIYLCRPMDDKVFVQIHFMNWEKMLKSGVWLLDFWAEWCTACKAQDPIYTDIKLQFGDQIKIGKVDVSDNRFLADHFGVRNIPHLLLMKDGDIITQMPGVQSKISLVNQIKKQLS